MLKFRLYLDTEKEVEWLNRMSDEGWKMTRFCMGFYTFEPCEKGRYRYQEDTTETFAMVSKSYRSFMEEAGIEIVQVWGPWVILCQEADKGEFELFTDYESKLAHQQKMLRIFKAVTILELIGFIIEVFGMIRGVEMAAVFMVIIGIILVACGRIVLVTKGRINRLKAENGELENPGKVRPHPVLLPGYLCYLCALLIDRDASELMHGLSLGMLIAASVFMVIGVFLTFYESRGK